MITTGTFYKQSNEQKYILALVGTGLQVALIGLGTGNRWTDPVKVKAPYKITLAEFAKIRGKGRFKKCKAPSDIG